MSTYVKENRDEFWAFRKETDWLVILHDGLSPISSHNPWNMCSRDVTWQIKNTIYPLLMFTMFTMPMFTRLTRVVTLQWGGHVGSRDKLNTLYLHLKDTYRHQTRKFAVLLGKDPTLQANWRFDYVTNATSRDN